MSNYRKNINILVSEISDDRGLTPLTNLVLQRLDQPSNIPKTLIFHDSIDQGIRIAMALLARLPKSLDPEARSQLIKCFYGSIDEATKAKSLADLRDGITRIVVCTDAFGLGVNIPDIDQVIQWKVNERLTCANLGQRIGRCVRDETRQGIAVIYVQFPFNHNEVIDRMEPCRSFILSCERISLQVSTGLPDEQMHMRADYVYNNSKFLVNKNPLF
jgi:superfamily II DNA/RNA helicase